MRLDKFIGHATDLTRSQIHQLIRQGAVAINHETARKAAQHIHTDDVVTVNSEVVQPLGVRYFMLNKPTGYVCANHDGEHPTVLDLLDEPNKSNLQIVGRLDIDTTGLVLLTDDGQWNHQVTSPRRECSKIYRVTTANAIDAHTADQFSKGLLLHGEKKPTQPAELQLLTSHSALLTIHEGKYHQIKRMFAAVGNQVVALHRERIGEILLDADLQPGEYRSLTAPEIASV
ncbi:MAG TPA: 16S rRNA pseudouridine(516) synthase RsuA [Cellvibrio sp.]|jgi:16S rRNA pseudouridine516 synthase|nr:16S rRNA pseudouridine(516) synthase RsuA [Cellvibrio sp.]